MTSISQVVIHSIASGMIFSIGAMGLGFFRQATGSWNVAIGSIMVGSALLSRDMAIWIGTPIWLTPVLSLIIGAALNVSFWLGFTTLIKNRNLDSRKMIVSTIGLTIVLDNAWAIRYGTENQFFGQPVQFFAINGTSISFAQMVGIITFLIVFSLITAFRKSNLLCLFHALEDNPGLVESCGWPANKYRAIAAIVSGGLMGLSAGLMLLDSGADAFAGMSITLLLLTSVLVGGTQHIFGWVTGAFVVTLTHGATALLVSSKWANLSTYLLLMVVLFARGDGLFILRRRLSET